MKRLLASLPLLLGGLAFFIPVNAQQAVGISPPRFEWSTEAGSVKTGRVTIFTTEKEVRIIPEIVDWSLSPTGSVVVLPRGAHPYSASDWINLATDPFTLQKGRDIVISFSVRIPRNVDGSYWAALSFTTTPSLVRQGELAYEVRVRTLSIVYITIAGTERPGAKITRFDREGDHLVLDVENTGNTYLRLEGELKFLNPEGKTVGAEKLPERVLLRDGLARMKLKLPKDLPKDAVIAAVEVYAKKPVPLPERLYAEVALR